MISLSNQNSQYHSTMPNSQLKRGNGGGQSEAQLQDPTMKLPKKVEGYFKKQKNEKASNFKKFFLAAAAAVTSTAKARFTKRWFILDTQAYTISYAKEKGEKPSTVIRIRDIESVMNISNASTQQKLQCNMDPFEKEYPEGYEHGLQINCKNRKYRIFSKDYNFKELFLFSIEQILKKRGAFQSQQRSESVQNTSTVYHRTSSIYDYGNNSSIENTSQTREISYQYCSTEKKGGAAGASTAIKRNHYNSSQPPQIQSNYGISMNASTGKLVSQREYFKDEEKEDDLEDNYQIKKSSKPSLKHKATHGIGLASKRENGQYTGGQDSSLLENSGLNQPSELQQNKSLRQSKRILQSTSKLPPAGPQCTTAQQQIQEVIVPPILNSEEVSATKVKQITKKRIETGEICRSIQKDEPQSPKLIQQTLPPPKQTSPLIQIGSKDVKGANCHDGSIVTLDLNDISGGDIKDGGHSKIRINTNAIRELQEASNNARANLGAGSGSPDKSQGGISNASESQNKSILIQINTVIFTSFQYNCNLESQAAPQICIDSSGVININKNQQISYNNNTNSNEGEDSSKHNNLKTPGQGTRKKRYQGTSARKKNPENNQQSHQQDQSVIQSHVKSVINDSQELNGGDCYSSNYVQQPQLNQKLNFSSLVPDYKGPEASSNVRRSKRILSSNEPSFHDLAANEDGCEYAGAAIQTSKKKRIIRKKTSRKNSSINSSIDQQQFETKVQQIAPGDQLYQFSAYNNVPENILIPFSVIPSQRSNIGSGDEHPKTTGVVKTLIHRTRKASMGSKVESIIDDRGSDLSDRSPKSPNHQDNNKAVKFPNDLRTSLALTNQKKGQIDMTPTSRPLQIIQTGQFSVKMPTRLGFGSECTKNSMFPNNETAHKESFYDIQNHDLPSQSVNMKKKLRYGANVKPTFINFNSQNKSNRQDTLDKNTGFNEKQTLAKPDLFYKSAKDTESRKITNLQFNTQEEITQDNKFNQSPDSLNQLREQIQLLTVPKSNSPTLKLSQITRNSQNQGLGGEAVVNDQSRNGTLNSSKSQLMRSIQDQAKKLLNLQACEAEDDTKQQEAYLDATIQKNADLRSNPALQLSLAKTKLSTKELFSGTINNSEEQQQLNILDRIKQAHKFMKQGSMQSSMSGGGLALSIINCDCSQENATPSGSCIVGTNAEYQFSNNSQKGSNGGLPSSLIFNHDGAQSVINVLKNSSKSLTKLKQSQVLRKDQVTLKLKQPPSTILSKQTGYDTYHMLNNQAAHQPNLQYFSQVTELNNVSNLMMMKQHSTPMVNSHLQNITVDDQTAQNFVGVDEGNGGAQGETSFDYNWDDDAKQQKQPNSQQQVNSKQKVVERQQSVRIDNQKQQMSKKQDNNNDPETNNEEGCSTNRSLWE